MTQIMAVVRRARAIVLAGLLLSIASANARAQLEVNHLEVYLRPSVSPESRQQTFTVKNVSDQAITTQLTITDWWRAIDGTNQVSDSVGMLAGSCHNAITVFPTILRLAPQQSQAVTVTYGAGERTTSCWSIIFVGTAPQPMTTNTGAHITVELRQGIKVYVEPLNARPDLQIDTIDTGRHIALATESPADTIGSDVTALVHNPGVIQARVKGRVEYRTLQDSLIDRRTIDEFPILPGAQRRVRSRIPNLPVGHYVALVIFDFGGSELVAGQIELDIRK